MSLFAVEDQKAFAQYIQDQEIVSISWPGTLKSNLYCNQKMPLFALSNGYQFQWGCTVSGSDFDSIDIFWIWNENGERIYTSSTTENPSYERVEQTEGGTVLKSQESMQKLLNQPPHPTPTSSPSPPPTSSSPFPALASTQLPDTSRPPPQRRGYVTKEGTYKKNPFTWSKVAGQKHRRFVPQPPQVPLQNQYQALADY